MLRRFLYKIQVNPYNALHLCIFSDEGNNSGDDREPERDFGKHVIHPPGLVTIGTGQTPIKQITCGLHHSGM